MSTKPICISIRLRRAARKTGRWYDAALADIDIAVPQYALLRAIIRLGHPTLTTLAVDTELDASTLGRNLRVLERKGLIEFVPGKDRRTRTLSLTKSGETVAQQAQSRWQSVQTALEKRLVSLGGREAFFDMLDALEETADHE